MEEDELNGIDDLFDGNFLKNDTEFPYHEGMLDNFDDEQLKVLLEVQLEYENYEGASKIKEEIDKRNEKKAVN